MKLNPFELGYDGFKFWRGNRIGNKIGRKLFPKITARREANRAAKKSGQAIPAAQAEVSMFPKGTQTLTGIALLVLVPWAAKYGISSEEVTTWVAAIGTVIGGIIAVFGYLRRKKMPAE